MKVINEMIDYTLPLEDGECRFFTANNTLKNNGELVMGAGNALAIKLSMPELALIMGNLVSNNPDKRIHIHELKQGAVASFQTKEHWRNPTPLHVLEESIDYLKNLASSNEHWHFRLPMPAVNNGGLSADVVVPMLEVLPDNVSIYYGK